MINTTKILLALSVLASLSACGGDDSGTKTVDAGQIVKPVDGGTVVGMNDAGGGTDSGVVITPTNDGGTTPPTGDCFTGTPVQMTDFLNRCTTAQTTTKDITVPAMYLTADGGVTN